jgi:hypothetical protein
VRSAAPLGPAVTCLTQPLVRHFLLMVAFSYLE